MNHQQYEGRSFKKSSDAFNDYPIPDQFIVSGDVKEEQYQDPMQQVQRKNIIIQSQRPKDPILQMMQQFPFQIPFMTHAIPTESEIKRTKSLGLLQNEMLKQIKQEENNIAKNPSSNNLKLIENNESLMGLQNIKGNVKNAYIKKINSLINMQQGEDEKEQTNGRGKQNRVNTDLNMSSSQECKGNMLGQDDEKMLKNRESARNSRQRKKLYIGLLERKVEDLTGQIEALRQQTEISFKHIQTIVEGNQCFKGMIIEQAQILEKLNDKLSNENAQDLDYDEMVQLLVDSYKLRFGAAGQRRKQYIKYCFQNIAKALLEGNYGPLLFGQHTMNKNYHLMEDEEFNSYVQQLKEVTGLMDENQTYKTLGVVRKLMEHKKNQKYLMKQLRKQLKDLRSKQQSLEDVMDDITSNLTPLQFAQFLTQVNKSDKIYLKEEYQQNELIKQKQSEHQINPFTQNLLSQLQLELIINNQKFQNNNLMGMNSLLLDPLTLDMLQKRSFVNQANKQ